MGGTGVTVPSDWHCSLLAYGDGQCDCGCGYDDVDCDDGYDIDDCEKCDAPGSCNGGDCPGKLQENNPDECIEAPAEWLCPDYAYFDLNVCDCGCGIADPDCEDETAESCDICNLLGSCASHTCDGSSIDPEDNSQCDIPEGWTCRSTYYKDGICDCGCGVVDGDCSSASVDACQNCYAGCAMWECPGGVDEENNAICTGVPGRWTCAARFYNDGSICQCGCGAPDPDCENATDDACDRCDMEGSCSARACPGTIDPEDNTQCYRPEPPSAWVCGSYRYADGQTCDCGCGAEDLDCASNAIGECEQCYQCGANCPGRIDPEDTTQCLQPPPTWDCYDYLFGDGYDCTCGCGARDPDCESSAAEACDTCPENRGSCSDYECNDINPTDNSRCGPGVPAEWVCDEAWFGDGDACDCGCGAVDADCASANRSACEYCGEGSCSAMGCATVDETNNAVCVAAG